MRFYLKSLDSGELSPYENEAKRKSYLFSKSLIVKSPSRILDSPLITNQSHINEIFRDLDKFEFNIFEFSRNYGREDLMSLVTISIFEKTNLIKYLSMSKFKSFMSKTRKKYIDNPYHNVNNYLIELNS